MPLGVCPLPEPAAVAGATEPFVFMLTRLVESAGLLDSHVRCFDLLLALLWFVFHLVTFTKGYRFSPNVEHACFMDENVLSAIVRRDEAVSFVGIKPFYRSRVWHFQDLFIFVSKPGYESRERNIPPSEE